MLLKIAAQTQNVGLGPKEISCVKSFLARSATNSEINRSFGSLLEVITTEYTFILSPYCIEAMY